MRPAGDPVRQTLDRAAQAGRARDAGALRALLSADYRDVEGNAAADADRMLRGYFAAYENLDVKLSDVAIERSEGAARARFRADLSGQPRRRRRDLRPAASASAYRFDVRLVRTDRSGRSPGRLGAGRALIGPPRFDSPGRLRYRSRSALFLSSSMAEHPAVNRRVVGSNPT